MEMIFYNDFNNNVSDNQAVIAISLSYAKKTVINDTLIMK